MTDRSKKKQKDIRDRLEKKLPFNYSIIENTIPISLQHDIYENQALSYSAMSK